jgi:hypothetical protein
VYTVLQIGKPRPQTEHQQRLFCGLCYEKQLAVINAGANPLEKKKNSFVKGIVGQIRLA